MMRQYFDLKAKYPDCILFFRLGDFYEMFDEDAETVAPILELTLTSREAKKGERIPMCGVPYHAAEGYISKLVQHGYKVAVCEQIQDPSEAKGLVERDVVRIVTPGTATDQNSLQARENRYLAAVAGAANTFGLSACDLSTGEFICTEFMGEGAAQRLLDELTRLQPPEILVSPEIEAWGTTSDIAAACPDSLIHVYDRAAFSSQGSERLSRHLGVASLDGFGLADAPLAVKAAGAVFQYLEETQKVHLGHITKLRLYTPDDMMLLDSATRRNLELTRSLRDGGKRGTLLGTIDRCVTALGGRLLKRWIEQPLTDPVAINERLDAVESFYHATLLRQTLREHLAQVYDIERLVGRVATGAAGGRDLVALRHSLAQLPAIRSLLAEIPSGPAAKLAAEMDVLEDVQSWIAEALVDEPPVTVKEGGLIRPGYHPEVDMYRRAQKEGKTWIAELEAKEREATGIRSLKISYNKVFGYYIEVTRANLDRVPPHYERKQTLAGSERFITPELKEKEAQILGAEERLVELEYRLFCELRDRVAQQAQRLQRAAEQIAHIDVWSALAHVAAERNYVRPKVTTDDVISIVEGRHPVVEAESGDDRFVPNDAELNAERRLLILTGPNMAGKSTYLRQVALIVLLAQMGSFVPAKQAHIGVVDRIFTRVGASDDLATGRSTFMVEMIETGNICNNATERSLVLIDELGRGTSTYDGVALAQAIAEYLHDVVGCKTIMSTHYHELTALEERLSRCCNYRVDVAEERGRVIFLYKVVPGGADRSYGINVARMAGLPREVLRRAATVLKQLEQQNRKDDFQLTFIDYFLRDEAAAASDEISPEEREVLDALRQLRLEETTPLQALQLLDEWQRRVRGDHR